MNSHGYKNFCFEKEYFTAYLDGELYLFMIKVNASKNIGIKSVLEIYSRKEISNRMVLITNRYFTKEAIEAARNNGIVLWDRIYIEDILLKTDDYM